MSLLPGQILPQSTPIGRVNEDGTVTADTNWWLLWYNLSLQTLGNGSGLPADALIDLESADIDAVGTDAAALRRPLSNALLLAQQLEDLSAQVANLQKQVSNAIALALTNDLDTVAFSSASSLTIANPSGTVGLTAVNGSTGKVMDAGSAPPLSQSIAPTMLGKWIFAPSSAAVAVTINAASGEQALVLNATAERAIIINGAAGSYSAQIVAAASAGNSYGLNIEAGTTSGDLCIRFTNQAGTATYLQINGDGSGTLGPSASSGMSWASTGKVTFSSSVGVNGATPPGQSTGWGTPTGASVQSSLVCGAGASLTNVSEAVGQIILYMKSKGDFAA